MDYALGRIGTSPRLTRIPAVMAALGERGIVTLGQGQP